ncbi:hypothetical protein GCM10028775_13290 [Catellatospora paridis]
MTLPIIGRYRKTAKNSSGSSASEYSCQSRRNARRQVNRRARTTGGRAGAGGPAAGVDRGGSSVPGTLIGGPPLFKPKRIPYDHGAVRYGQREPTSAFHRKFRKYCVTCAGQLKRRIGTCQGALNC